MYEQHYLQIILPKKKKKKVNRDLHDALLTASAAENYIKTQPQKAIFFFFFNAHRNESKNMLFYCNIVTTQC